MTERSTSIHDVAIVGGGVAGLALARELRSRGRASVVLERARGVGGRCATRRIDGQPVDHGLPYVHGRGRRFLDELNAVEGAALPGWPRDVDGAGLPCRPEAFTTFGRRLVWGEGVTRLAKHLARGLDVRLGSNVTQLVPPESAAGSAEPCWQLRLGAGAPLLARAVALTPPAPAAAELLRRMDPVPPAVAAVLPLLDLVRTLSCLTVIARYATGTPVPPWQASFPASTAALHSVLHDSSKRSGSARLILVLQARPAYSAAHADAPAAAWARTLLEEAAALHGSWVARPEQVQTHVWRRARIVAGTELASPVFVTLGSGAALGVAGDGLHRAGGVEGAYASGIALAERFAGTVPIAAHTTGGVARDADR